MDPGTWQKLGSISTSLTQTPMEWLHILKQENYRNMVVLLIATCKCFMTFHALDVCYLFQTYIEINLSVYRSYIVKGHGPTEKNGMSSLSLALDDLTRAMK